MTDRLSQLLHDEATHLSVPPPDAAGTLAEGRRLRRRHRATTGLAVAAGVAVTGGGIALALALGSNGDRDLQPADVNPDAIVWGYDSEVHLGDVAATVPGTVLSLDHTSVGVLAVSTTADAPLGGSGRLTLVRYDGTTEDLGELSPGERPVTDPAQDVYVLTDATASDLSLSVYDAETGEVRQQIDLPDLTDGRPAGLLSGDTLRLQLKPRAWYAVDLTTGDVARERGLEQAIAPVTAGRVVLFDGRRYSVRDIASGTELMNVLAGPPVSGDLLSPDGQFLRMAQAPMGGTYSALTGGTGDLSVYDVTTGEAVLADVGDEGTVAGGWTLGGELYQLTETSVIRCEVPSGTCNEADDEALPTLPEPTLSEQPLARVVVPGTF